MALIRAFVLDRPFTEQLEVCSFARKYICSPESHRCVLTSRRPAESFHAKAGDVILLSSGLYQPSLAPVPYGHAPLGTPCSWLLTRRTLHHVCKHAAGGRQNDSTGSVLVAWSLPGGSVLSCPVAESHAVIAGLRLVWVRKWTRLKRSSLGLSCIAAITHARARAHRNHATCLHFKTCSCDFYLLIFSFLFVQEKGKKSLTFKIIFVIAFEESEGRAGLIMAKNQVCKLLSIDVKHWIVCHLGTPRPAV